MFRALAGSNVWDGLEKGERTSEVIRNHFCSLGGSTR